MNVYESFAVVAALNRGRRALIYLGETLTYGDLFEGADALATGLAQMGVGQGDRLIIYIPNTPQWVIAWLSIQKLGAVAVPITPIYTSRDLRYISSDSGARTIICADTNFGYVKELRQEGLLDNIIFTRVSDLPPNYTRLVGWAFDRI